MPGPERPRSEDRPRRRPGAPDRAHLATPTLMRSARGVYAQAIRAQLHELGIDDLPRNGAFLLAGIGASQGPRQELQAELGVTKQAVSLAVDLLVRRGYVERGADAGDRRRVVLLLTDRGRQVLDAVVRAVQVVDRQLEARVPSDHIEAMRSVLIALSDIKTDGVASGTGRPRRVPDLRRSSPIFAVRDLAVALAHYETLGFATTAYEEGDGYGFSRRDAVELHLAAGPAQDVGGPGAAYLYVRDADALYEEWSRPGIAGHTHPVGPTPYHLREGSHVDPDGNLIRFGSPVEG
ncbi:MAG TPA: MarR family transcriptional regulator [Acidimicrobiales bacterium]